MDQNQEAKIKWRCRRGMLELDLILEKFINHHLKTMEPAEMTLMLDFLNTPDPILYAWLMGEDVPEKKEFLDLVQRIRDSNL